MPPSTTKPIAFFDVDHTLVNGNTGFFSSLHLMRYGILKQRRIAQALYYSLAAFVRDQDIEKIYEIAIADMAGFTTNRMLDLGRECFERDIKRRLYKEGLEAIEDHRKKGHTILLLTSGPTMIIRALKDYLQVDGEYSVGPEVIGDVLTTSVKKPICYAEGKVHYAKMAAAKAGVPLSECYFYSDHGSDIAMMKEVGHPIAVNPDRQMRNMALRKGWMIRRFAETIGNG